MSADDRIQELGIKVPLIPKPGGNYVHAVRTGSLLYLSGKGPLDSATGKVGADVSVEQAYEHARTAGLNQLSVMRNELSSLDEVVRVVKVLGMVNATPDFEQQPAVINGCSDLFIEMFAAAGHHARTAVGMGSLPGGITAEIECIVEVA